MSSKPVSASKSSVCWGVMRAGGSRQPAPATRRRWQPRRAVGQPLAGVAADAGQADGAGRALAGGHGAFAAAGHAAVAAGIAAAAAGGQRGPFAARGQAVFGAGAAAEPLRVGARVVVAHAHHRVVATLVEAGVVPGALLERNRRQPVAAARGGPAGARGEGGVFAARDFRAHHGQAGAAAARHRGQHHGHAGVLHRSRRPWAGGWPATRPVRATPTVPRARWPAPWCGPRRRRPAPSGRPAGA